MGDTKQDLPVIGIAQVQQMLKDGKTREDIRLHYGLNKTNLGLLFKHPELIGKKTIKKKAPAFTIVDDETVPAPDVKEVEVDAEEVVATEEAAVEETEEATETQETEEVAEETEETTGATKTEEVEEEEEEETVEPAKASWTD